MHIPRPEKLLFQIDDGWGQLFAKHGNVVHEWTKLVVERMLACGTGAMGVRRYGCILPTVLTPNTSAKVVKAKAAAPVA